MTLTSKRRRIAWAAVVVAALLLVVAGTGWVGRLFRTKNPARPNVIIYMVDALRADHLGCYGYKKPTSPHLDKFAHEAILFENAIAQSSWTKPSVASILTGVCPLAHGVNHVNHGLPEEAISLAEILRAAGYATASFSANIWISPQYGFDQGFDDVLLGHLRPSDQVNQGVFTWLDEQAEQPFFLYIHTMDPHAPYYPPPEYWEKFARRVRDKKLGYTRRLNELKKQEKIPREVLDQLIALYDAEIAFNDNSFGDLVEELRERGLYDNSLIIFVADHGEEFHEHGHLTHHRDLYREALHVPLLVKLPRENHLSGARISQAAQHVDILPTVLDALHIETPSYVEGRSLLAVAKQDEAEEDARAVFSYLHAHGKPATPGLTPGISSISRGRWKLLRSLMAEERAYRFELYDKEKDPLERANVVEQHPEIADRLLAHMKRHEQHAERGAATVEMDEELRKQLRAVGYLE